MKDSELRSFIKETRPSHLYIVGDKDYVDDDVIAESGVAGVMSFEEIISKVSDRLGDRVVLKQKESDGSVRHFISLKGEISLATAFYDMLDSTAIKDEPLFNEDTMEVYTNDSGFTSTISFVNADEEDFKVYDD